VRLLHLDGLDETSRHAVKILGFANSAGERSSSRERAFFLVWLSRVLYRWNSGWVGHDFKNAAHTSEHSAHGAIAAFACACSS
jgi:hypothetical protein